MGAPVTFYRGATFTAIVTADEVKVDGVTVTDLTGWTARCTLRTSTDVIIEELAATIIDPVLRRVRLASAGTASWPKGEVRGNVLFIGPGGLQRVPTGSFSFHVADGPTR